MTTIAGTLFLIWFFFSPLLAAGTYFRWVSPEGFLPAFIPYLISVYALTGIAAYCLAQLCGGIYVKEKEHKPIDIGKVSFYKALSELCVDFNQGLRRGQFVEL